MGMKSGQFDLNGAISLRRKAIEKGLNAYLIAMDEIREDKIYEYEYFHSSPFSVPVSILISISFSCAGISDEARAKTFA